MADSDLPDLELQVRQLTQIVRAEGHEHWWLRPEVASLFEREGYHLVPQHFHASVPTLRDIEECDYNTAKYSLEPVGWRSEYCAGALQALLPYWEEFKTFAESGDGRTGFVLDNPFYASVDAFALYALVRRLRPRHIIEITAEFSTHVAYRALQQNGGGSITCINPHPSPKLQELADNVEIIHQPIQDVDRKIFNKLGQNDILFIDSSHVSRLCSDVNFYICEILPNLAHNVVVQVHDIFLPFEYPEHWIKQHRWFWNEQYVLYAYLLGARQRGVEVMLPVHLMIRKCEYRLSQLSKELPGFGLSGVGFWFRTKTGLARLSGDEPPLHDAEPREEPPLDAEA